ncbi:MAG: SGNH/GDSL hydrolase family protein, partial [Gammaproteobacteria bacterium]
MKRFVFLTLFSIVLTFAPLASQAALTHYFFGDSLSDTGNTFALTGGLVPSSVPVTGLPYYNGRASNGPVWVDQLAADPRYPGSPRSVNNAWATKNLTGYDNFATFGAYSGTYTAGPASVSNTVDISSGGLLTGLPGLGQQVDLFGALSAGSASADAWYSIWAGANDLLFPVEPDLAASPNQAANRAYDNLSAAIGALAGYGAQDFLLFNLPDLSR